MVAFRTVAAVWVLLAIASATAQQNTDTCTAFRFKGGKYVSLGVVTEGCKDDGGALCSGQVRRACRRPCYSSTGLT